MSQSNQNILISIVRLIVPDEVEDYNEEIAKQKLWGGYGAAAWFMAIATLIAAGFGINQIEEFGCIKISTLSICMILGATTFWLTLLRTGLKQKTTQRSSNSNKSSSND